MAAVLCRLPAMQARCQCGGLSAQIDDGAQAMTVLCHCLDCQRRTGSPFGVMAYFPREAVTFSGPARDYERKTDQGDIYTNGFCPCCGSTVYTLPARYPDMIGIAVGALANPHFPPPDRSVFEQSRHSWVGLSIGMPAHSRGRDT